MPQSRKNKDRKQKLLKYKKSKKMNQSEQRPFHQVPSWDSTEKFEVSGAELEALYGFFNIFAPALTAVQQVFARGIQAGKVKMDYVHEDGSAVDSEELKAYTDKLNEYFKNLKKDEPSPEEELGEEKPTAKILSFTGEPATAENV